MPKNWDGEDIMDLLMNHPGQIPDIIKKSATKAFLGMRDSVKHEARMFLWAINQDIQNHLEARKKARKKAQEREDQKPHNQEKRRKARMRQKEKDRADPLSQQFVLRPKPEVRQETPLEAWQKAMNKFKQHPQASALMLTDIQNIIKKYGAEDKTLAKDLTKSLDNLQDSVKKFNLAVAKLEQKDLPSAKNSTLQSTIDGNEKVIFDELTKLWNGCIKNEKLPFGTSAALAKANLKAANNSDSINFTIAEQPYKDMIMTKMPPPSHTNSHNKGYIGNNTVGLYNPIKNKAPSPIITDSNILSERGKTPNLG